MTDRIAGFLVTLESDLREDDVKRVVDAMVMLKGVLSVEPIRGDATTMIAESRAKIALYKALAKVLEAPLPNV